MIDSNKPVELVIFDCDGVLADSERIAVRVQQEVGAQLGRPLTEAEVARHFTGRSHGAGRQVVAERLGEDVAAHTGGPTGADTLTGPGTVLFSDLRQLPALLRATTG
ncbi:hypothetical protein [Kitasatospora sp. NPDC059673]|uniref:hypothetical protein n=1 Tax=Kitasatospora sp. NPDC059673 TaxID=3346901 RepID=UPI003691AAE1